MARLEWTPPDIPRQIVAGFSWQKDYADEVHNGRYYLSGSRGIARPWTEIAIAQVDLLQLLKAGFKSGDLRSAFLYLVDQLILEFAEVLDNFDWQVEGDAEKQYRPGIPTWKHISDSGELRDSLEVEIYER